MGLLSIVALVYYILPFVIVIFIVWWVNSMVSKSYEQKERHFQLLTEQNNQLISELRRQNEEKHL
ncbi:hypothetical protein ERX27_06245 [Macrococcus brunensis]|uniref:Uncharacterized protein n=1 Tax=Macrococcus brunensis TaxID=198483 RepID=A0A4R6BDP8_9STAP|nr:hypothetical protein [Macrococcus brunensis]TDL97855.1 hypothetical protein ERX27_06245 [Macrococcus brunensis]